MTNKTNNKYKVLLVEDEANISCVIAAMLEASGYQVIQAETVFTARMLFASFLPDLVLLDLGLPDRDGMDLLRELRQGSLTPILVLSARTTEQDKVDALDCGANDYVTKPFSAAELLARVRSLLRISRFTVMESCRPENRFILEDLTLDFNARQVFIRDEEIRLTQTEFNILAFLAQNAGRMMTYAAIIRAVWGKSPQEGSIKRLQVNMTHIRKKFGVTPGKANYFTNELGVGYRMNEPLI